MIILNQLVGDSCVILDSNRDDTAFRVTVNKSIIEQFDAGGPGGAVGALKRAIARFESLVAGLEKEGK